MADDTPLDSSADDEILEDAFTRFKRCQDFERDARENIAADMRFAEGDSYNNDQWPENIVNERSGKPMLTNNMVRQHNLQIVNDARQNKAGIEIRATSGNATYEAAKVFEGIVRHIESISDAETAYDTATYHQVYGGIGYVRVVTDYADDETFDQEIFIRRVNDPNTIYLDPDIQHYDGSDARFAFVFSDMDRREFKREYPDFDDVGMSPHLANLGGADWVTEDKIRIAEFYRKIDKPDWLTELPENLLPSKPEGGLVRDSELDKEVVSILKQFGLRRRKVSREIVQRFKIAGGDIIGRTDWPGKYIPIARFVGEETVIDGRLDRKGHTRAMISAQQMHNYFYSAAAEHVALQTKTPYLADVRAIEGYEEYWRNANTKNFAYLPYNAVTDDAKEVAPPRREPPPEMAQAFIQGLNISSQLIMDVSGQHQANLGEPSNEKSGVAIQQRQRQGDNATAHYIDHGAQAIRFLGRIIVDLVPKVYDTKRVVQILEPDGTRQKIQVDPDHPAPHQQIQSPDAPDYDENAIAAIFNPSMGRYGVEADIGPSFATKRQDAFNAMSQIMAQNQELMKIAGDLLFRNGDFPGADDIADRIRRSIPPALLGDDAVAPQVKQLQQQLQMVQQHAHQILGQADQEKQALVTENERLKADLAAKLAKSETDQYRAETDRMATVGTIDPAALVPVIREQVSQLLGVPAVPVIQAHQVEDAMHQSALDAASAQQMQAAVPPPQPSPAAPGATTQTGPV